MTERLARKIAPRGLRRPEVDGYRLHSAPLLGAPGLGTAPATARFARTEQFFKNIYNNMAQKIQMRRGLESARTALRPGGVLAVWSAAPDTAFARRLKQARFAVDEVKVRARANGKGPTHTIWFATVP